MVLKLEFCQQLRVLVSLLFFLLSLSATAYIQEANGDGGKAIDATLSYPSGVAVDRQGNLYIAERRGDRIRKVDIKTGIISTFAGTGVRGFSGDLGPATKAQIAIPEIILIDQNNDLIITDRSNHRVRKIDIETGIISTIAGNGEFGYSGDGGLAIDAMISNPYGLMVDDDNNLYIVDTENHAVRKVDAATGIISTAAGNGERGFARLGGSVSAASFNRPHVGAIGPGGQIILGDSFNHRICIIDQKKGKIIRNFGSGTVGLTKDGEDAENGSFAYFGAIIYHDNHIIYSGYKNDLIRTINLESGTIKTLFTDKDELLKVIDPYGMALDHMDQLYISESSSNRVLRYHLKTRKLDVVAGN